MAGRMIGACGMAAACVLAAGLPALAQPLAGAAGGEVARFEGHKVVRVAVSSARDMRVALALTEDVWSHTVDARTGLDIRVSPEQFAALGKSGLRFEVMVDDVQALIDAEAASVLMRRGMDGDWYDTFHTYDEIKTYCQGLAAAHPDAAEYIVLGTSHLGRDIFGLRIAAQGAVPAAERPAAIYFACQHAREWATPPTAVYLAEMLLAQRSNVPRVDYLVRNMEMFIVPIANPDGYVYTWTNNRLWRKNRRPNAGGCTGVDLNRNWGHEWGGEGSSSNTCNDLYRGPSAFSEAETQVIRDFVLARPNIAASLDIHSYGQLVMSPWAYTPALPPDHAWFMGVNGSMAEAIQSVHGREYTFGPIYSHLYPAAGCSVDWFYGGAGVKAFTTEVRAGPQGPGQSGFVLPEAQILPNAEENYAGELALAEAVAPCYANCDGSSGSPVLNVADFTCFLQRFAAEDPWANCDFSTGAPMLNVGDFTCFLQKFAAGGVGGAGCS